MGWERSLKNNQDQLCNVFTFWTLRLKERMHTKKKKKTRRRRRLTEKQTVGQAMAHRPKEENIKYY